MRHKITALAATALLAGGVLAAAPAASARSTSPTVVVPFASSNSAHSYGTSGSCAHSSDGWFVYDGDTTHISDTCQDGWSAVLEVDEQPIASSDSYDYLVWDNNGVNTTVVHTHNITEGHEVCVRAGIGHPSTGQTGDFGAWECGYA